MQRIAGPLIFLANKPRLGLYSQFRSVLRPKVVNQNPVTTILCRVINRHYQDTW